MRDFYVFVERNWVLIISVISTIVFGTAAIVSEVMKR